MTEGYQLRLFDIDWQRQTEKHSHTGNAHINKNVCFRMTRNNWNPKYCLLPK